jgi:hypothetical protein
MKSPNSIDSGRLTVGKLAGAAGSTLGAETTAAFHFARLLVILAATHFLLYATTLYQLSESPNCFLNRFAVADHQLDHSVTPNPLFRVMQRSAGIRCCFQRKIRLNKKSRSLPRVSPAVQAF